LGAGSLEELIAKDLFEQKERLIISEINAPQLKTILEKTQVISIFVIV